MLICAPNSLQCYTFPHPVPIIAVFTKYDMLVENVTSQDTPANDDLYGDIEDDVDGLDDNGVDDGSTTQVQESPINASYLALANEKLRNEMIKPFEKTLDVPWVAVSGLHTIRICS
jgi:hypothetical protein